MTTTLEGSAAEKEATAPDPDDPRKPKSPPDLHKRSWMFTSKMAFAEYKRDQCSDLAAALTFYAVSAVFPAFIVLAALVGLIGQILGRGVDGNGVKLLLGHDGIVNSARP